MTFKQYENATKLGIDITRKFRVVKDCDYIDAINKGDILELVGDDNTNFPFFNNLTTGINHFCCEWSRLEYAEKIINNNKNFMSTLTEKFVLAFVGEPEKSFRKTGITDGDNLLTEEGSKIFLTWLLQKNKEEFKKECVDSILEEQEIEKK